MLGRRTIVAALALLVASVPPARADTAPAPCRVDGLRSEVLCGSVTRPLDPARPEGRRIEVHYVVVPAVAQRKLPDPVFMLAGGPGQSAIAIAPDVVGLFSRLNNRRDLVFVDQRGTGRSAPLRCEEDRRAPLAEQLDTERSAQRLQACPAELAKLPHVGEAGNLRFFTTTIAMQDLDAVRRALGAPRINLVGGSYGTRAALEYMRQFPDAVRRAVIDGVAPPDMVLPDSGGLDAQVALDAVFAGCRTEPACAKAHPRLREDVDALLASLPKEVAVQHPVSGRAERVTLTREALVSLLRSPLYAPVRAAALPAALAQAAQGRFEALVALGLQLGPKRATELAAGMHFSVVCAEDAPRMGREAAAARDFGAGLARPYAVACERWPRGAVPDAFYTVPAFPRPVWVASGGLDPVTPPRHGERVAKALGPAARHVVVPNAGHGTLGIGCVRDLLFRFIDAGRDADALAVDASCATAIPRPPFAELPEVTR